MMPTENYSLSSVQSTSMPYGKKNPIKMLERSYNFDYDWKTVIWLTSHPGAKNHFKLC